MEKVVVALGGNALQAPDSLATAEAQLEVIKTTTVYLADIIEEGYNLIVAHGNGPQVGRIVIQNEVADSVTPAMPFDVCGAMSQGMIGYHMQQALGDELRSRGINKPVATIVTQVVVDKDDDAFKNPTKPIGPFYTKEEADKIAEEKGYVMVEDSGRGYRRVVASPTPQRIVEIETVKTLVNNNNIVITVGGGGIPVIEEDGKLSGAAAVIDKDLASQRLAEDTDADILVILTGVPRVAINFGKPDQKELDVVTPEKMRQYAAEGHFAPGSMLPKVIAAIEFAESKPGRKAVIASLDKAKEALKGESGTIIEA
ncbi:carbamate kinase [Proteiniborus ethanoligenes]|uniref:Carbamate kinase n=1 Tax=Proteiniborus ethanoligenes TaxID=415015 RepID=A0A1H3MIH6_9FIRM|nr:carbamate kinase [Proteiniborus ethanoligenes]SDY76512.1 carbamate kinase [Proteiniborus ethanoligenes]